MRFKCFVLVIGLGLVFGPAGALAPLRGQAGGGGERDKAGRQQGQLQERWHQLAGDAKVWRRADITDPLDLLVFDLVAERVQSTNGEITKEQFLAMSGSAERPRKDETAKKAPAAESPKAVERRSPSPPSAPAGGAADVKGDHEKGGSVAGAEAAFRRRDANHDGLLDTDEMDEGLRAERDRWDANGDGFIDLTEFKAYVRARSRKQRPVNQPGPGGRGNAKPIVKGPFVVELPEGLPPWFSEYDRDGDGQIGLYEWKAAGQPLARFRELDFNGDGFITPDEILGPAPPKKEEAQKVAQEQPANNPERARNNLMRAIRAQMLSGENIQIRIGGQ
jgi:hypothetical protein